jgi:hypothetical protein
MLLQWRHSDPGAVPGNSKREISVKGKPQEGNLNVGFTHGGRSRPAWTYDCIDARLFVLARESALKGLLAGSLDAPLTIR